MGAVLGGAGGGYFLSPLFRKQEESWIDIGRAADFLPGVPTKVEYIERKRDAWITTEKGRRPGSSHRMARILLSLILAVPT